jgi:hypothetical protein
MPFPVLRPTSRDFKPGDYPIKAYNAQSGAEVRILYGDTRSKAESPQVTSVRPGRSSVRVNLVGVF